MHSFKKWGKAAVFLILCVFLSEGLKFLLLPPSYSRLNMHNIRENRYDDIYLGTSHGFSGIAPKTVDQVTGRKSTNLCLPNEFPIDSYYLLREVCRYQKPERIIYELDPGYWVVDVNKGKEEVFIYNEMPPSLVKLEYGVRKFFDKDFRYSLFPWYFYRQQIKEIPSTLNMKFSDAYRSYDPSTTWNAVQFYKEEGFLYHNRMPGENKGDLNIVLWNEKKIKKDRLEYFQKMVDYCKKEGIELIGVTLPVPQATLDHYPEVYQKANAYYTNLFKEQGLEYLDFNAIKDERIDRSMDNYYDYDGHMYGDYAEKFGIILGEYLK